MPIKALVIEDTAVVRRILRARLEQAGWEVTEAQNPAEGWESFQVVRPQLVSLDIVMPSVGELDSFALFKRIRAQAPDTAIIVVSVSSSGHDRDKYMREGAVAFASKPFVDFDKILTQVTLRLPFVETEEEPSTPSPSRNIGHD
jgi:two-component system, chemotaxis family, chemotaxis protein CheY